VGHDIGTVRQSEKTQMSEPKITGNNERLINKLEKEYAENARLEQAASEEAAQRKAAKDAEDRRHWLEQEALKRKPTLAEKREATKQLLLKKLKEKENGQEQESQLPVLGKILTNRPL